MDVTQLLERAAGAPSLLLATDFDGTISEVTAVSGTASTTPRALEALQVLSRAPGTTVAVVTGRTIEDVTARTAPLEAAWYVGEHGAEIAREAGLSEAEIGALATSGTLALPARDQTAE